ncbi:hypothetical protein NX722_17805 [Endozoicomonas gorgoniicola]|uniref:Uncharacterized protein n=1 Tax=Endozoicomonas gorgoniicola TaxID=1234144 RepID=A0ABT3MZC7_9GAMM|nr:hypothetical protein [Endozoicomonas gorgoniicola]MCW7554443.1 hypothetical protein [Endozoicomonas gorgoniicola]
MAEPAPVTLLSFLEAVIAGVKKRLPTLKACDLHCGRFDASELKQLGKKAPAIYLAALAVPGNMALGDGRHHVELQLTAFVVAKDLPGLPRDRAVLNLVESLMLLIPDSLWGLQGQCSTPQRLDAHNIWNESGVLPKEVYVGIEPDTGTGNEHEYERIV